MEDALRSGRSARKGVWVQIPPSAGHCACSSAWIERSPAEAEVAGSSPARRAFELYGFVFGAVSSVVRAPLLQRGGRRFESSTAHIGVWRSPVAHLHGVQGVGGSNPLTPIF